MPEIDWEMFAVGLIVSVLSITLHEFGHAISADRLGDVTPRSQGRITLWPDKHFDPIGFLMIVVTSLTGFGLGWGKPVMVMPRNFRRPGRDMLIVALCGPLMNLLLAVAAALLLRVSIATGHILWWAAPSHETPSQVTQAQSLLYNYYGLAPNLPAKFAETFLTTNLSLLFFNLIPVPPLDGSKVLAALLPPDQANLYERFIRQFGTFALMILLFTGAISAIIGPAIWKSVFLLLGPPG